MYKLLQLIEYKIIINRYKIPVQDNGDNNMLYNKTEVSIVGAFYC